MIGVLLSLKDSLVCVKPPPPPRPPPPGLLFSQLCPQKELRSPLCPQEELRSSSSAKARNAMEHTRRREALTVESSGPQCLTYLGWFQSIAWSDCWLISRTKAEFLGVFFPMLLQPLWRLVHTHTLTRTRTRTGTRTGTRTHVFAITSRAHARRPHNTRVDRSG